MALARKTSHDAITLRGVIAINADGNASPVRLPGMVNAFVFVLDVTAAQTDVGDTLDVYVQTNIDSENWLDVVRFTQIKGNGGAKRYVAKIEADTAVTEFETGAALGAAAARDLFGDDWRVRWDLTQTNDAGFTIKVTVCPM